MKRRVYVCDECHSNVDDVYRFIVPVPAHTTTRWLCWECREHYIYSTLEGWDEEETRGPPTPAPSDPPPDQRELGPLKPADSQQDAALAAVHTTTGERGQPQAGGAPEPVPSSGMEAPATSRETGPAAQRDTPPPAKPRKEVE